jgi:predicted permease
MNPERAALHVYRVLIRALPREFRESHGTDLALATEDVLCDVARRHGRGRLLLMAPRLFGDLVLRAAAEHWRDLRGDARFAVRMLVRAPGFTLAAVLCLAIGTGLTAAMYAQVQSTVLADVPGGVREPDALIRIHRPVSGPEFVGLRDGASGHAQLAGYVGPVPFTLEGRERGDRYRVWGQLATASYFDVLGIRPTAGRLFGADEEIEGGAAVVLSERLWRTRFDARPSIVGESIRVNGQLATVIGVAAPGFAGASPMTAAAEAWIPTTAHPRLAPELTSWDDPRAATVQVVGRLERGVSASEAERAMETVARRLEQADGDPDRATDEPLVRLLPGGRMFPVRNEDLPRAIGFPLVLVSLVLLMACGNVANMMLARGASRYRELAIRLALGAGRGRVVRQLTTESLFLSALGSAAGAVVALWLLSLFARMRPIIPGYVQFDVHFHWRSYLAAAGIATLSTVLFSLAPSLRASRLDIQSALKPNSTPTLAGRRRFGLRNLVVYQQVSVSVVLVLLTSFVVVGWQRATGVDLGFNPAQTYFLSIDPIRDGYPPQQVPSLVERLRDRLRASPAVVGAAVAQTVPLAMSSADLLVNARSDIATGTQSLGTAQVDRVGAGFFETVGTALVRGRTFTDGDESNRSRVVVVNEAMAGRAWPGSDPIGQPLRLGDDTWEVIGVVADIRSAFPLAPTLPAVYQPVTAEGFTRPARNGVTIAVRVVPGTDGPSVLLNEARATAADLTVVDIRPLMREVDEAMFLARVATYTYGGMGILALVLATVGLAGVTAYAVARRTREIGIRMALGARRPQVLWLVLRESAGLILAGTFTGLVLALVLTRALSSVLEALAETTRTSLSDPLLLVGGPGVLIAVALTACYLPARRSIRIDPLQALRSE